MRTKNLTFVARLLRSLYHSALPLEMCLTVQHSKQLYLSQRVNWSVEIEITLLPHSPFISSPSFLISQMDLSSKFRGVIVHQQHRYWDEKWEGAPYTVVDSCTLMLTQSKTRSCHREKPICVQKQNTSQTNNGLNHSVITTHAKQDLIKTATRPRSPLSLLENSVDENIGGSNEWRNKR